MKKILKKIKNALSGLSKQEMKPILDYYTEIINDRLERNETIESIDKSIDYHNIKLMYNPDAKEPKKVSTSSNKTLLLLLASPFLFALGLIYVILIIVSLTIAFVMVVTVFALIIASIGASISFGFAGYAIGDTLIMIGILLLGMSLGAFVCYGIGMIAYTLCKILMKPKKLLKWKEKSTK